MPRHDRSLHQANATSIENLGFSAVRNAHVTTRERAGYDHHDSGKRSDNCIRRTKHIPAKRQAIRRYSHTYVDPLYSLRSGFAKVKLVQNGLGSAGFVYHP
jgi:hypothetical protein